MTNEKTIDFGFEEVPLSQKAERVRGVFDKVASKYDLMNDAMSMGVHRVWKSMMISKINPRPGEVLIDVAGGTGDIARKFINAADTVRQRRGGAPVSTYVCDINAEMLLAGLESQKDTPAQAAQMQRVCGDAQTLPFPDGFADVVTISFGIRNFTDRAKALVDIRRVLKPGGRFFCLEFSTPPEPWLRQFYDAYSFNVIPALGGVLVNDRESYQYLVESIRKFPRQDEFADMIRDAGFSRVQYEDYSGGICALHWGWNI